LGRVHVLQLHKATPEVLKTDDLARAWEFAAGLGISILGTSVKDLESAKLTLENPKLRIMQIPFNQAQSSLAGVIEWASARDVAIAVTGLSGWVRCYTEMRLWRKRTPSRSFWAGSFAA
jgi:hypothetical protein